MFDPAVQPTPRSAPRKEPKSVDNTITAIPGEWTFSGEVAEHFDEHVRKSTPFYDQIQSMVVDISEWFVRDGSTIFDLGSSTGETIRLFEERHRGKRGIQLVGIDNSLPMIEKAREKCRFENVNFLYQQIAGTGEFSNADFITSIFTLQFLDLASRRRVLERIHRDLNEGGAFVLVEKVRGETSLFEDIWIELYWDMKHRSGLNSEQVLQKARSLRGVLMPLTVSENVRLLREVGFQNVDVFMKWYNWTGILAVKMEHGRTRFEPPANPAEDAKP